MNKLNLFLLSILFVSIPAAANTASEQINEAMKKASKVKTIPSARSIVVFGELGESVVITDNPRYVVKGELYDMWQDKPIKSLDSLEDSAKKLPLSKIKVNTTDLLDIEVNPEKFNLVTIFLDPFDSGSANVMTILNKYASNYRLRYIFTSTNEAHIERLKAFACEVKNGTRESVINAVRTQQFDESQNNCDPKELVNTLGLTGFLRVTQSPTIIAPNDTYIETLPKNLMQWLTDNKE